MRMPVQQRKQGDIVQRLSSLARGNISLVTQAICAVADDGHADVDEVIRYILVHRGAGSNLTCEAPGCPRRGEKVL